MLLIISVVAPHLSERLPLWVQNALQPNASGTMLSLAIALAAATFVYWRMNGLRNSSFVYLIGVFLSVSTFVLALPAYYGCTGAEARMWSSIAWTMSLFLGNVADPFGLNCSGPMPLALQVARLTAIMTTFLSLTGVLVTALKPQRDRVWAKLSRNMILVTGLNPRSADLIRVLAQQSPAGTTIVLLEPNRSNPAVDEIRRAGVRVVFGDPHDGQQIEKLCCRQTPMGKRTILAAAYVLHDEPSDAVNVASKIIASVSMSRADGSLARLCVRIDDPQQAEEWRRRNVSDDVSLLSDTIGLTRITAQAIVDHVRMAGMKTLVVVGSSPLALAVLDEYLQHQREQSAKGKAVGPSELVLMAPDAALVLDDLVRSEVWHGHRGLTEALPGIVEKEASVVSIGEIVEGRVGVHVVLADPPSASPGSTC
jgi:hypothetical protein